MKKVFSTHQELAHIWASQSQEDGRCGNMFFRGKEIYSYGGHFCIARFINKNTVLFTTRYYSPSTSRHASYVRSAIGGHITVVHCFDPGENLRVNLHHCVQEIKDCLTKACNARSNKGLYEGNAVGELAKMEKLIPLFLAEQERKRLHKEESDLLKEAKKIIANMPKVEVQYLKAVKKENAERLAVRKEREEKRQIELIQERERALLTVEQWLKRENVSFPRIISKMYLRLTKDGKEVQTSLGAMVPVTEAQVLYHCIMNDRPVNGFKIGPYEVINFVNGILTIGCHKIEMEEIERFGHILDGLAENAVVKSMEIAGNINNVPLQEVK